MHEPAQCAGEQIHVGRGGLGGRRPGGTRGDGANRCANARGHLSWSRAQGLFAVVALEGATLRPDFDDNATLYGKKLENRDIVTKGLRPPKAAAKLLELLNRYSARERTE